MSTRIYDTSTGSFEGEKPNNGRRVYNTSNQEFEDNRNNKINKESNNNDFLNSLGNIGYSAGSGLINAWQSIVRSNRKRIEEERKMFDETEKQFLSKTQYEEYKKNRDKLENNTIVKDINKKINNVGTNFSDKLEQQKQINKTNIQRNIENSSNPLSKKVSELSANVGDMAVGAGLSAINPALGTTYFINSASQNYYDEGKARGMTDEEAGKYSTLMGIAEGGSELIGVGNLVKGTKAISKSALKQGLKDLGIGAIDNAIQEAIIEPTSELAAGKYADWDNILGRTLQAGLDGALIGGGMGVVGAGIGKTINTYDNIKNNPNNTKQAGIDINNTQQNQTNPISPVNTQQESNTVAPVNTLENNQNTLYNNSNEMESDINEYGEEQRRDYRTIQELFRNSRRTSDGQGNDTKILGNEKARISEQKQKIIEYAEKYPAKNLTTEEKALVNKIKEKTGIETLLYNLGGETSFGGLTRNGKLYIDKNIDVDSKNLIYHELIHGLRQTNNPIYTNEIYPVIVEITNNKDYASSLIKYISEKNEKFTMEDLEIPEIRQMISEEIIGNTTANLYGDLNADYDLSDSMIIKIKNAIGKIINDDIENSNQSSFSMQENKPIPPINNIQEEINRGKQSSFYKNALTSQALNEEAKKQIRGNSNIKYYEDISNAETFANAMERLENLGDKAILEFNNIDINNATAEDITLGFQLMQKYQNKGDYHTEALIAERLRQMGTKKGQAVQAFSILQRMSPEGMLIYTQRQINNAKENILQNKSQSWIDKNQDIINNMDLTEEETQKIVENMQAINEGAEGREKEILLGEIQKIFTDKIPPTLGDSFKAYRRIAMLFNPKTQVRNVFGNLGVAPINMIGDSTIGALTDKLISKKTGIRTTGATDLKTYGKAFIQGGVEAFDDFRRGINTRDINGDKFEIGNKGKSFTDKNRLGRALNKIDGLTNFALDVGDRPFFKAEFMNALNNQMKLNNVDTPTVEMIETATRVAEQRTWQDNNKYSDTVVNLRRNLNNINIGGVGFGDIVIPFAKTPANLTKAIVDYSPLGVVNAIVDANNLRKSISKGNMNAIQQRKLVDDISKAFMGSMLYMIGYGLAKAGISSGESDKDKDVANFEKNILGIQPYSIKIGDKSFTYDWAQPLGAPLGIMANAVNKDKNESMAQSIFNAVSQGGNMIYEQSFLQNLKKLLSGDDITKAAFEAVADIPASLVPTFMKQIAEVIDPTARASYEYNDIVKTGLNKTISRVPFASKTLSPSVDTMGRDIQKYGGEANLFNIFLNPATTSKRKENASAEEIYRLYKETGDKSVFPRVANYYETLNKEKLVLSSEQKAEVQKTSGIEANKLIENTIKTNAYKKLSNDQKVDIINDLVNYTFNKATNKVIKKELSPENKSIQKYIDAGLSAGNAVIFKNTVNNIEGEKDKSGNSIKGSSSGKKALEIMNMNVNNDQKNIMLKLMTESKNPETVDTLSRLTKTKDAYTEYFALNKSDTFFQSKISRDDMQDIQDLGINQDEFMKYAENISNIKSEKDSNGKTISGSKKKNVANYINSLNLSSVEKAILFAKAGYADNNYKQSVYQYINKQNLSASRKNEIWESLGYK